jgi:c-di-GMP-binding flagellar brake protein YcgR
MRAEKFMPHLFLPVYRQKSALFSEYLLKMLAFEKSPILFLFDSHVRLVYTTMVLDADRVEGTTLLDGLHPEMGNDHLISGTPVTFFGRMKGIDTGFQARIQGKGPYSGSKSVLLSFPFETYYLQRRTSLRVPLPEGLPPVCLRKIHGASAEVRPVDVGGGGLRVLLPERTPLGQPNDIFDVGDLVLIERIDFDGFHLPPLSGRVVHREHSGKEAGENLQGIGIAFVDFPKECEEPLLSYVSRRDRELLKNYRLQPGK